MARPTDRLDCVLLPVDPHAVWPDEAVDAAISEGRALGWFGEDGQPGTSSADLVVGGFVRFSVQRSERPKLVANALGGFRVACPACGANLAPHLHRAAKGVREGGPLEILCPACGQSPSLDDLAYRPPAGWSRHRLDLHEAGADRLNPAAQARLEAHLGPLRCVGRRI